MKLLIVSDIHALTEEILRLPKKSRYAYTGLHGNEFKIENRTAIENKILALEDCLKGSGEEIDALVCLGDFSHQSKKLVMLQAWHDLHLVAKNLDIKLVIGITGNHDISSRIENLDDAEDRTDFLKNIVPKFPSNDGNLNSDYHSDGIGSLELKNCLLLAFDTCRLHGYGSSKKISEQIWKVGNLSKRMIDSARSKIENSDRNHIVVIMHHRPITFENCVHCDDAKNGKLLLEVLANSRRNCVVVHGHKHEVALSYAPSGSPRPIVMSAGSIVTGFQDRSRDQYASQFHLLEFDTSVMTHPEVEIKSWKWGLHRWELSGNAAIPSIQKFGLDPSLDAICKKLENANVLSSIDQKKLFDIVPDIQYLTYEQFREVNERIKCNGQRIIFDDSGHVKAMIYQGNSNGI